jgi:hypothetical protein
MSSPATQPTATPRPTGAEHYDDAPSLAGKPGVGLVLDPGRVVALHDVGHDDDPGFVAVIKGGDSPTSFTQDVSASQTVSGATRFAISGGVFRYYELWITRLGPGFIDARVNEVTAT